MFSLSWNSVGIRDLEIRTKTIGSPNFYVVDWKRTAAKSVKKKLKNAHANRAKLLSVNVDMIRNFVKFLSPSSS